jgi:hypoxanthine phosphoribosyltransferase
MKKIKYSQLDIMKDFDIFYKSKWFKDLKDRDIDLIIPIIRGGLYPTHLLSYALNVRNIFPIDISFYDKEVKRDNPVIISKVTDQELQSTISSFKNILIVDDLVDSGDTIREVSSIIKSVMVEKSNIYTFALLHNRDSNIDIDYYLRENFNNWIVFDWDKYE